MATQVPYLARYWAGLLSDDALALCRVTLVTPDRDNSCRATADGLLCDRTVNRTNQACGAEAARVLIPYNRLVVATFDAATLRYELTTPLPAVFTPPGDAGARARAAYDPHRLAAGAVRTALARDLLDLPAGSTRP